MESSRRSNMFIMPILMKKKKHDLKAWLAKESIIKKCKSGTPTFAEMCEIVEFLAILRKVYMYGNDSKFHLFLATLDKQYNSNNCLAMVYKENNYSFTFILFRDTQDIKIEITRSGQNMKSEKEQITVDKNYQYKDEYDAERMLFIVASLMDGVVELIEYYYRHKKL